MVLIVRLRFIPKIPLLTGLTAKATEKSKKRLEDNIYHFILYDKFLPFIFNDVAAQNGA
jgi:ABC-type iron transport system FetAB ATPase subunit